MQAEVDAFLGTRGLEVTTPVQETIDAILPGPGAPAPSSTTTRAGR